MSKSLFLDDSSFNLLMIRKMELADARKVLDIYGKGLETRMATFETTVPSWDSWDNNHHRHSRFVYEENGKIMGWAALSPVSKRSVYAGVAEVSIYVDPELFGRTIGSQLMEKLIISSEENGIWTLYSSIFRENRPSFRLHEKFRFRQIGYREKIAKLDGQWKDTLLLERRSNNSIFS